MDCTTRNTIKADFGPILANPFLANPFFLCVCCCGWFWCGKVFSVVCFCLFVVCVLCVCVVCCEWWVCSGLHHRTALRRTAQNFALFFTLLPPQFSFFFLLSLNFGGVLEGRNPWALGLSCETPAAPPDRAARARTRQLENSKRAHLSAPAFQTLQNSTKKTPQRGKERMKNCGRRGSTPFGHPPFGAPLFLGLAPHLLGPHHDTKNVGQKIGLAKIDFSQNWLWPKLAKSGWPKRDWPKSASSTEHTMQRTHTHTHTAHRNTTTSTKHTTPPPTLLTEGQTRIS